ncbi:MAG: glycerophosphodiester phosphodiesterase [Acidimicrobiales bacterium]|nr:glycerophosphodiester phosphodiesterase [Acidimicrobiales bacterium]
MPTRLPSLRPTIAFAHRGARAHAPENTIEAFELGLRLGASGLESDVWITREGVPILDHDGVVRRRLRKVPIASHALDELPEHIPTLGDLYDRCGVDFELSLDLKEEAAVEAVIEAALDAEQHSGEPVVSRLWLCLPDWEVLARWRERWPGVRLVNSTRLKDMGTSPERRGAQLSAAGIDCVNMHHSEWTGGLVTLFHRFELYCFGWDAQLDRIIDELVDMGIDGVFSDHVDRLNDVWMRRFGHSPR